MQILQEQKSVEAQPSYFEGEAEFVWRPVPLFRGALAADSMGFDNNGRQLIDGCN